MKLSKDQLTYSGEIPERFTLDEKLLPPLQNQNGDNRCAAYAISGIMTVMARSLLGEELDFSKAYIYGKYRAEGDGGGNGGMFESQIVNICEGGACLFLDMPDIKDRAEAFSYVRAHTELSEKALKYAPLFKGYIDLKESRKQKTLQNIKAALIKFKTPIYAAKTGHAFIICGYDGEELLYRDCNGFKMLFSMSYKKIKEAILFVMNDKKFIDVSPEHWASEAIDYCAERGIMQGTGEDAFSPGLPLSRAEAAQIIFNLRGGEK